MAKLLDTLYVTSEGAYVRKDGETVAVEIDGATRARAPAHLLGQIVCFGQTAMSPDLIAFAVESGISIAYLGYSGQLLARVEGRRAATSCCAEPSMPRPIRGTRPCR